MNGSKKATAADWNMTKEDTHYSSTYFLALITIVLHFCKWCHNKRRKKNQRNVYWNYAYFPFFSKISTLVDNLRILSCIWNWSVARTSSKSLPWWRRRAKRWCEDTSKISICRHKACTNCLLLLQTEEDQNHLDIKRLSYHFAVHSLLRMTIFSREFIKNWELISMLRW